MKYYIFISEILGFVVISTSAATVCILSSFLRLTLKSILKLIAKLYHLINRITKETISTATKADTKWIVIRIGKFSILLGKKDESRPNTEPARENH